MPGKLAYPVGKIDLEVAFGDEHNSRAERLTFEVVKIKSMYHTLFGRPAYAKFMARPCLFICSSRCRVTRGPSQCMETGK